PVDVILRDGSTLRLRAPVHDDTGALLDFFNRLSERSRYLRFHGARLIDASLVEHVLDSDGADRGALFGILADGDGGERAVAVAASLRRCFAPSNVAVIGASKRRGSIGGELFRNMLSADFAGAAYPVNRTGEAVAGVRGYRAIEEIPAVVDLAVICVPGELV